METASSTTAMVVPYIYDRVRRRKNNLLYFFPGANFAIGRAYFNYFMIDVIFVADIRQLNELNFRALKTKIDLLNRHGKKGNKIYKTPTHLYTSKKKKRMKDNGKFKVKISFVDCVSHTPAFTKGAT